MDCLPPEVVLQVVDCLAQESSALRHLSLVSSSYTALCQELLFSDLTLRALKFGEERNPSSSRGRELLNLLTNSTHIRWHIHGIHIVDDLPGPSDWLHDPHLAEALKVLVQGSQIERFTLDRSGWKWGSRPLEMLLSPTMLDNILNICQSPNLQSLSLIEETPIGLVRACGPSVKTLNLKNLYQGWREWPLRRDCPIRLTSLQIGHTDGYLSSMIHPLLCEENLINLSFLTSLSISTFTDTTKCVNLLLQTCATSLKRLDVTCTGSYGGGFQLSDAIDLCRLVSLKNLDFNFETFEYSDSENVEWVIATLATLPRVHVVEGVRVKVKIQEGSAGLLQDTPWGALTELIANQQKITTTPFPFHLAYTKVDG